MRGGRGGGRGGYRGRNHFGDDYIDHDNPDNNASRNQRTDDRELVDYSALFG